MARKNIMDKYTLEALNRLIEYVYDDEAKNFEECEPAEQKNHIFTDISLVSDWVKKEMGTDDEPSKFKIFNENCVSVHKVTEFDIELPNGNTISISKSVRNDDIGGFDDDWNWLTEDDKKLFDSLSEETQDELTEFIGEIKL